MSTSETLTPFELSVKAFFDSLTQTQELPDKITDADNWHNRVVTDMGDYPVISSMSAREIIKSAQDADALRSQLTTSQSALTAATTALQTYLNFFPAKKVQVNYNDKNYTLQYSSSDGVAYQEA